MCLVCLVKPVCIRPTSRPSKNTLPWRSMRFPLTLSSMCSLFQLIIDTVILEPPQGHFVLMVSRSSDESSPSNTWGRRVSPPGPKTEVREWRGRTSYSPNSEFRFRRILMMGKP